MKLQRLPFLFVGLIWLALTNSGCSRDVTPEVEKIMKSKEKTMILSSEVRTSSSDIPPIDVAAPEVYQTATFGLG
jgi:hypothetical protein